MNKFKNKTIGEYRDFLSVKGKHPSWVSSHIRNFNRIWNANLRTFSCQVCGYSKHIELAHIKPISSFHDDTLLSVVNDPGNVLVFCPNHHWEFDNNLLKPEEIKKRDKPSLTPNTCSKCFRYKTKKANYCRLCASKMLNKSSKIKWCSDQELQNFVLTTPITTLSKKWGVSDTAILKRCKNRNITTHKVGYWTKKYNNKL